MSINKNLVHSAFGKDKTIFTQHIATLCTTSPSLFSPSERYKRIFKKINCSLNLTDFTIEF